MNTLHIISHLFPAHSVKTQHAAYIGHLHSFHYFYLLIITKNGSDVTVAILGFAVGFDQFSI